MEEKSTTDILDLLEGTYLAIEDLNNALPGLKKEFQSSRDIYQEIQRISDAAQNTLKEANKKGTEFKKSAEQYFRKLTDILNKAEVIQKSIETQIEKIPDNTSLLNGIERLAEYVDEMKDSYDKRLDEIDRRVTELAKGAVREERKKKSVKPVYNNKMWYSIEALSEFEPVGSLIVVRSNWFGDYCFYVMNIVNGIAYGTIFKNGNVHKLSDNCDAKDEAFRLYEGPSRQTILDSVIDLPFA